MRNSEVSLENSIQIYLTSDFNVVQFLVNYVRKKNLKYYDDFSYQNASYW